MLLRQYFSRDPYKVVNVNDEDRMKLISPENCDACTCDLDMMSSRRKKWITCHRQQHSQCYENVGCKSIDIF